MRRMPRLWLLLLLAGCRTQPFDLSDGGADGGVTGDQGVYKATLLPTALNRISIIKSDAGRDLCFSLLLVNPESPNMFGITLPAKWSVQEAWASKPASNCAVFTPPMGAVIASGGNGAVGFDTAKPCTITLSASLRFPANTLGVPAQEPLTASNVKVSDNTACP
jgi:hypothetical protein